MQAVHEKFLKHFDTLIEEGNNLPQFGYATDVALSAQLKGWESRCLNLIEKTFGKESDYYDNMKRHFAIANIDAQRVYGIEMLKSAKQDFQTLIPATTEAKIEKGMEPLLFLERLCSRFHLVARQLRERHDNRATLDINDEYDVQDLLHSLLKINFNNIVREEYAPTYACGASRMDFLLKNEGIVVEVRKTRSGLSANELGQQLIVDIARYQTHPDCKLLVCFIYDPEGRIANPEGLERDLTKTHGNIEVKVIITPRALKFLIFFNKI